MENTHHTEIIIEERLRQYDNLKIYLKIPITTRHSDDISNFKNAHIVEGKEFIEKDIYNNEVRCWYVSTTFKDCDDKEWLIEEISECGCVPTLQERKKGYFV